MVSLSPAAKVKSEKSYQAFDKIVLSVEDAGKDAQILWDVSGDAQTEEVGNKLYVWAKPGKYTVTVTTINFETKKVSRDKAVFTVEGKIPEPPPDPNQQVTVPVTLGMNYALAKTTLTSMGLVVAPATATTTSTVSDTLPKAGSTVAKGTVVTLTLTDVPPPDPAPIPVDGYRVLMLFETGTLSQLPAAQQLIRTSGRIRDYLKSNCVTEKPPEADNDGKGYRIWDPDTNTDKESKHWQDVMKRPRKSLPWLIISNGKTGYEGPMPDNVDKTLELLKKYELPSSTNKEKKESK